MDHIIENHSTIHICQTCNNRFPTKTEMVEHMKREHGFKPTNNSVDEINTSRSFTQSQQKENNHMKCFDCGFFVQTKDDLMQHKKSQHRKQKPCPHFHGVGNGCKFPERVCFNIHTLNAHQGQVQGVREEGRKSWTRGSGGQGQINNS